MWGFGSGARFQLCSERFDPDARTPSSAIGVIFRIRGLSLAAEDNLGVALGTDATSRVELGLAERADVSVLATLVARFDGPVLVGGAVPISTFGRTPLVAVAPGTPRSPSALVSVRLATPAQSLRDVFQ